MRDSMCIRVRLSRTLCVYVYIGVCTFNELKLLLLLPSPLYDTIIRCMRMCVGERDFCVVFIQKENKKLNTKRNGKVVR